MKVKCDHRSKFSNLSNWKEEAWKKIRASTGFEPMTSAIPVRCSTTELWSHTLGARSIYWVHFFPCSEIMWNIYEIIHICTAVSRRSWVRIPLKPWFFFRLLLSSCLNWKIYCDDHTLLSSHTAGRVFFRWSALYGVSDSFADYPYGFVYLFSSLSFSSFLPTFFISLSVSLSAFFFRFPFSNLYSAYYVTFYVSNYCMNAFFLPLNCNK